MSIVIQVSRRALAFLVLALCAASPVAQARSLQPGERVHISGCVLEGESFVPIQRAVLVQLPDWGVLRWIQSDREGRFSFSLPAQVRVIVSITPDAPLDDQSARSVEVFIGSFSVNLAGCLVSW